MLTLGLDTTAGTAATAIVQDGKLLCEYTMNCGNTHSTTLLPMIENMLSLLGKKPVDIDLYACAVGPGSFTGVRIGAATVKGLAQPYDTPCVPVSALAALAQNLVGREGILCPVMNARRQQVYTALFDGDGTKIRRLQEDCAISVDALAAQLREIEKPVYFTGDGYDLVSSLTDRVTPERLRYQSAVSVALLGYEIYTNAEDKTIYREETLLPTYLRKPQAQREREARLQMENSEKEGDRYEENSDCL